MVCAETENRASLSRSLSMFKSIRNHNIRLLFSFELKTSFDNSQKAATAQQQHVGLGLIRIQRAHTRLNRHNV